MTLRKQFMSANTLEVDAASLIFFNSCCPINISVKTIKL